MPCDHVRHRSLHTLWVIRSPSLTACLAVALRDEPEVYSAEVLLTGRVGGDACCAIRNGSTLSRWGVGQILGVRVGRLRSGVTARALGGVWCLMRPSIPASSPLVAIRGSDR